ncbi:MAG: hypothetical protein LBB13_03695 [Rickettsiales bacterium]|jgi:non-canonical purine NTP pyrophosphatase (RdgB/HAM1 family)|nr:hypothetical protein [Rickettsiales bacterium]
MEKLFYLTTNEHKVKEANKFFGEKYGFNLEIISPDFEILEIQAKTCAEVARFSAKYACEKLGYPVLKSDSGLYVDCLGGLPGPYNSYFDKQVGIDKFLTMLDSETNRRARLEHCFAYCEPGQEPVVFSGGGVGVISHRSRGELGRWHDRFFIPEGENRTLSELRAIDHEYEATFWGDAKDQFARWYIKKLEARATQESSVSEQSHRYGSSKPKSRVGSNVAQEDDKIERFPVYEVGHIFNPINISYDKPVLKLHSIGISYPCRLDAMAIDPCAVAYNDTLSYRPGEVVVSIEKFLRIRTEVIDENFGELRVSQRTRRTVLVKHAYKLMCAALNVTPSLSIEVIDDGIPKHCGFGSSSSTIAGVCASINELYGNPIEVLDLIRYVAMNHGEEVADSEENKLKAVQCIGGGASGGMLDSGIIVIAGQSTPIAAVSYDADVIIGVPLDFRQKDAAELMELEENNLYKFVKTGEKYRENIAYNFLHRVLPGMVHGDLRALSDIVFDYRFNMGSIENCSFVFPPMIDHAKALSSLYRNGICEMLSLSSVGPAFFAVLRGDSNRRRVIEVMRNLGMSIIETRIFNNKYIISSKN